MVRCTNMLQCTIERSIIRRLQACSESAEVQSRDERPQGNAHFKSLEADMNKAYEVPAEMRDFAERSVAQARKAFEGFLGAVQKTAGGVDTAAIPGLSGAKDVSMKAVSF